MPRKLLQRSRHVIVWLGILPAILAVAAYLTSARHLASVRLTLEKTEFLRDGEDLLSTLKDAETGQRGFLLTGNDRYLIPYQMAVHSLPDRLRQFESAAARQGVSQAEVNRIHGLISSKMDELGFTVRLRKSGNQQAALHIVDTNVGQQYMTEIRGLLHEIREQQQTTLRSSMTVQQQWHGALISILSAGVAIGMLLVFLAYQFSGGYARQRDLTEEEIRKLVLARTHDLEERTRELEQRSRELQRSNADLLQFAYVASHDLQEPLRTVSSYVELLARKYGGKLDEAADKYIQFAISGANRMQALISDLLTYSRVGTQNLELTEINLGEVVGAAVQNLDAAIQQSGASVRWDSLPTLIVDASRMTQVLQNLISNAIKFSRAGIVPDVHVFANAESQRWVFGVADNGMGFDQKYEDRIFQVFQRLHGVGKFPGNGIGLAVCRRIVEHHGGQLWVTSEPGQGSTFFFSLPREETVARRLDP